jgi:hypothetical protein
VPTRPLSRRILSIPNPQHQIPLCAKLVDHWAEIDAHCQKSKLSLSAPSLREASDRAVTRSSYFKSLSVERILRSAGCRIHLYADFTRYYSSIYTHSIAWALHGKDAARSDERTGALAGNQLDKLVRNTQDRQSIGIPVGPDSSFILAEIIGSSIDQIIVAAGVDRGLRYVDDFHLYFRSRAECERAIAAMHRAAREYELDINDAKTVIENVPDVCEPSWKIALRLYPFGTSKKTDAELVNFFNLAFQLALDHPFDGVLKYAVSRSGSATIADFKLYGSFLCRCMIAEPLCLPDVFNIWIKNSATILFFRPELVSTLEEICRYHAPLQHGYEVAWAVWFSRQFRCQLQGDTAKAISGVEDDTVALVSMDAKARGLLDVDPDIVWRSWLDRDQLSGEHWLAAYEFAVKNWLHRADARDYVAEHDFFATLRRENVSFYNESVMIPTIAADGADPVF